MRFPLISKIASTLFVLCSLGPLGPAVALEPPEFTTITLQKSVYFLGTDGSPTFAEAGQYTVEPAEDWIRLIPDERRNALLIEANPTDHEEAMAEPMAISLHGKGQENPDIHHVIYLFPDGTSLDAVGTYSGIRTRGLFKRIAARPRIRQAVQAARSKVQQTVQKVGQATSKVIPPNLIQAAKALGPDMISVLQCLKTVRDQRRAHLPVLVQQLKQNPKEFIRSMIQDLVTKLQTKFPYIMEPQLQMVRSGFQPRPTSAQIIRQGIESWKRLAETHPGARCLVPLLVKYQPALQAAALELEATLRKKSEQIFKNHIAPALHAAIGKGLSKVINGKNGSILLTEDELKYVANGVYAKFLIQQLKKSATTLQRFTRNLGNDQIQGAALSNLQTSLNPQAQWPPNLRLELGTEIVRAMGHKYLNSNKPGHGGFLVNQAVGLMHWSEGTVEKVASAVCGLIPEVGAAICAVVETAIDGVWNHVLVPGVRWGAKKGLHAGIDLSMDQAKKAIQQNTHLTEFRQSSGSLNSILNVLSKDLLNHLAETHLKDTRRALDAYNNAVLHLAHASANR